MIVYPTTDFNSWISEADADLIAQNYVGYPAYAALPTLDRERYLMQAFRTISNLEGFTGPDETVPDELGCLPEAQVQFVLHDLKYGISTTRDGDPQIASLGAGPTSISYFEQETVSASAVPSESSTCLAEWGVTSVTNDSALSSMRMTR